MTHRLKQIIPSEVCLACKVCCRYPERISAYVPYFFPEEAKENVIINKGCGAVGEALDPKPLPLPYKSCYICQFFDVEKNSCHIYSARPFDCQLYPFMVTYDKECTSVFLVLDSNCPYVRNKVDSEEVRWYIEYLVDMLEDEKMVESINNNKNFINDFQENALMLKKLDKISERICFSQLGMRRISLRDKKVFDEYFSKLHTSLSFFSFVTIYIWSGILNILWKKIDNALCIFAGNERDYFLLVPPIDGGVNEYATRESLEMLSLFNGAESSAARIENIPEDFFDDMISWGLNPRRTSQEYIYTQRDLAELRGDRFKSKRALVNYFTKNYTYEYRALEQKNISDCLKLYRAWAGQRLAHNADDYFRLLIEDSYVAQKVALMNFELLHLQGRMVAVDGIIKGYSMGFSFNDEMFVILFETTDRTMKGLAQFLFRAFSYDLSEYTSIATLSDSGLENLKRTKNSYHPVGKIPVFTAYV